MVDQSDKPLVTIAIPFYNNGKTLIDAIKSVYAQTYPNWELLLLNDGSTDNSLKLVEKLNDRRVKVVDDGVNRGLVYRLNQVTSLASGRYIARMDGDDMMLPTRIAKQVKLLQSDERIDWVDAGAYTIDDWGNPVGKRGIYKLDTTPRKVLKKAMAIHGTVMAKKEWFVKNPYDPVYLRAEDYELWCRTCHASTFARVREPLYLLREGRVSITNYRKSMHTLRRIFRVYGPGILSKQEVQFELLKTHLKSAIYTLAGAMGMQDRLSAMRNVRLSMDELGDINAMIDLIRGIMLPTTDESQ